MNTRTRPERNLEKLEHEPEKCDWKTTDTQKMRSRKCRTGPSVCGKRPPNSSIYVSTSEVKTTTEGITTLSPAGLVAWGSAGCRPHRKTPRSRKFNSTENMKTTSETETLQQHPQASAERAPRQATRKRREREKEEAAALHTGGGRRWPIIMLRTRSVIIIISAPNENSQKASKSVNVLAAGSQDRICVNEHQN